jgi:putative oxidoreductase
VRDGTRLGLTLLRAGTAIVMMVHGLARWRLGIVDDFGTVLGVWGFPAGLALAWTITIVEIVGGAALAAGWFVRPMVAWFIIQLVAGIYLIHGRVGWFVVGAGRNGMEFSTVLILCLIVIALTYRDAFSAPGMSRRHPAR